MNAYLNNLKISTKNSNYFLFLFNCICELKNKFWKCLFYIQIQTLVIIYSSSFIFYLLGILLIDILWFCNVQWMWKWKSLMSESLWPRGLYSLWNSLGQNTGVGNLSLPQGIFPTQGSNPGLPNCRRASWATMYSSGTLIWKNSKV